MAPKIGKAVKAVGKTVAKTKIVRTVIGGKVIETPVETADPEVTEEPKKKAGRPKKESTVEPEPASDACGIEPPVDACGLKPPSDD